jgi:hypothetical protein
MGRHNAEAHSAPLTYFSLYPFIDVERAVEPVNVLNTLSSKPDLKAPASFWLPPARPKT